MTALSCCAPSALSRSQPAGEAGQRASGAAYAECGLIESGGMPATRPETAATTADRRRC